MGYAQFGVFALWDSDGQRVSCRAGRNRQFSKRREHSRRGL